MGTGSLPAVKRPRRGADLLLLSRAEVKERVEMYLCSSSGPSWPVLGLTLPFYIIEKGKAIPLQVWICRSSSVGLRLPEFVDIRHMKVVMLFALRTGRLDPPTSRYSC